jgi:outer membrane protein assembly factor BamB/uncharacterized protein YjdB
MVVFLRTVGWRTVGWRTVGAAAWLALGCDSDGVVPPGHVAFVGIQGVPTSKQLYVGHQLWLTAATYDRDHHLLTGIPVTWTSSDTAIAVVSAGMNAAVVFGKAPGPVVITASSQGQSASANLTVAVIPVAAVRITPSAAASYVGLNTQFTAVAVDSGGSVLPNRSVTWTSSDQGKATVDGAGLVTAHALGTVMITATVEGKSAPANLTILSRPTADWSSATDDWVTFQGNGSRTGYVAATLDPVIFRELWMSTPAPGASLNPVTVGGGKVFVSTDTYFGTQLLTALDAANGVQKWSHNFGPIHSVHPPAYDNGTVYASTGGHSDSFIWAFDAQTGVVRFRTSYSNQWSRYLTPVVVGDALYMAGGYFGGMYSFSTSDGSQRWFVNLGQYDGWTPAVRDGLVYAYTGEFNPQLTVVDAATGATVYRIADPSGGSGSWLVWGAPVLGGSNNVLSAQGSRLVSFDLQARSVGWQRSGTYHGNVTVANGVLYVFTNRQVEARRESDGSLLWVWIPPEGEPRRTMVVTNNLLFVSTDANTYAVDLAAHMQVWSYPAAGHLALSNQGLLLIAQSNGKVTAIAVK